MRKRSCLFTFVVFLGLASLKSFAIENPAPQVKPQAEAVGLGHGVKLTMKDGTLRRGKLTSIEDSSISIDEGKKKGISTLSDTDIASVHRDGLKRGQKIGLAVGVAAAGAGAAYGIWAATVLNGFGNVPCTSSALPCFP